MKERPILMCGEMVRATLEDRKTRTRRVVNLDVAGDFEDGIPTEGQMVCDKDGDYWPALDWCPYGKPGDRLWVRETFAIECNDGYQDLYTDPDKPLGPVKRVSVCGNEYFECPRYRASEPDTILGDDEDGMKWRPSIFMPRWASRILLEITEVRVQRLQEITEEDAQREGCPMSSPLTMPQFWFEDLWDKLNKKRGFGWDKNPWVWVVGFGRLEESCCAGATQRRGEVA